MSTEDGPGLRTTVFLKGCSLQCSWCHNPEAMCMGPQLVWHSSKCIGAGACEAVCPEDAIVRRDGTIIVDSARCTLCGDCVEGCPSAAMEILGTVWELDALVAEVAKDRSYFDISGGGVTISGGEPGLQAPFVGAFLDRCRALGLGTAVDTAGLISRTALVELARRSDVVLYDLKEIDSGRHACVTGQPNERILGNVIALGELMRAEGCPRDLWIRTPLIPGVTATEENLRGIGAFLAEHLAGVVSRWELCAFNNLAADKYGRLGLEWPFQGVPLLTRQQLRDAENVARDSGVDPAIVIATGRTRVGEGE
ncbi:MAG: glycyl-radical enzyme activating protein [Deltaproteobacteria bacterium]|nr:glycyl-radical enzyme activating protein [Deltaproteobacteria bacterium]